MVTLNKDQRTLWYCIFVPACCSLAASIFTLGSYLYFPKIRTPTMRLVMLQTLAQFFFSVGFNVAFYNPPGTDTPACRFQGFMLNMTLLSSILFTSAIAGYMVHTMRKKRRVALTDRNLAILSGSIVVFASAMAAMPFISDQYVNMGPRCWIAEDEAGRDREMGIIYRFTTHYCIIWACIGYIMYAYYRVIRFFQKSSVAQTRASDGRTSSASTNQFVFVQRTISVLIFYPIICFIVWVPLTVIRIITAIDDTYIMPIEVMGFALLLPSIEGLLFGLVFSRYRVVQDEWRRLLCRPFTTGDKSLAKGSVSSSSAPLTNRSTSGVAWYLRLYMFLCLRGGGDDMRISGGGATADARAAGHNADNGTSSESVPYGDSMAPSTNDAAPQDEPGDLMGHISERLSDMHKYVVSNRFMSTLAHLEMEMPDFSEADDGGDDGLTTF